MADRYYNLMPQTPENNRIRKALEVYDLKRNTSEPTYYLKHTVPTGVNKIKGGMCNCGHNNRLLDRPMRQVLEGGSFPGYITADDMDARGKSRRPPGGVVDTKMTGKLVRPGTMVRYPGYNMNEQKRLDMEGGFLSAVGSAASAAARATAAAARAAASAAASAASQAARLAAQYGPQILQTGLNVYNDPNVQKFINSPEFQQMSEAAMAEAMKRMAGGKLVKFEEMEGGSMFSAVTGALSSGAKTAAAAAAQAAKLASAAALEAARLAAKHGPAVLQAGVDLYNDPKTQEFINSPEFKSMSEMAMAEAIKKMSGGNITKLKGIPKNGGFFGTTATHRAVPAVVTREQMAAQRALTEQAMAAQLAWQNKQTLPAYNYIDPNVHRITNSPEFHQMSETAIAEAMKRMKGGSFSHLNKLANMTPAQREAIKANAMRVVRGSGDYPALEKAMKGKGYGSELDKLLKEAHSTTMKKMKGSGRGSERAQIVKSVMMEQGLSLPMASKYVKEHNLY
jgi:hypothetical protein